MFLVCPLIVIQVCFLNYPHQAISKQTYFMWQFILQTFWQSKSEGFNYSCMVIILFNTGLCRSAFSTISLGKLDFRLSVLSAVLQFFNLNQMLWIKILKHLFWYFVILLFNFVTWFCSHFLKTHLKESLYKNSIV